MNTRDWLTSAAILLVGICAWQACRTPHVSATPLLAAKGEPHEDVFSPVAGVATDSPGAEVKALKIVDRTGPHCDVIGGLPGVVARGRPVVGEPFEVHWSTRPTSPPEPPDAICVLLVSNRPAVAAPIAGAPGCWLSVHPDHVLVPQSGGLLTRDGGRVFLHWTPSSRLMGVPFYVQLLVQDARNAAGVTVAPPLYLRVGTW